MLIVDGRSDESKVGPPRAGKSAMEWCRQAGVGKQEPAAAHPSGCELAHQQVREQVNPAEAALATRREPTHQEIYNEIREVVGLAGPMEYLVSSEVEGMPGLSPSGRGICGVRARARSGLGRGTTAKERTGAEKTGQCETE